VAVQWGSIADWVSGIGSLAAAIVALHVAHSSRRIKLTGYAGHRVIFGPGQPRVEVFAISVTNSSLRPTVVTNVGFTFGFWRWRKQGVVVIVRDQFSDGVPKTLGDGDTGSWNIPLGKEHKWLRDLASTFPVSRWAVWTWRVRVYTSNGDVTTLRPGKTIRQMLLAVASAPDG
jgi:hypothetical protein